MSPTRQNRIAELESLFVRYPDVTKEAIIKNDLLRRGLCFTEAALDAAKGCRVKSYRLFTYDKVKYDHLKKAEPFKVPEDLDIIGGPYQLRRTNVQVRLNPESPYVVDVVDGKVVIRENSNQIAEVEYPPAPNYYSKTFGDGTKYSEVVAMANTVAFATVYRVCQFWGEKEECKFCDINENIRQGQKFGKLSVPKAYKPVEQVATVMEEIFLRENNLGAGKRPLAFIITGGSILKKVAGKSEDDFYLDYVSAIRERIGHRWLCMLQTMPKDKKGYKRLKDWGVDCHHAQLEVWDRDLFKVLCPGKEKYVGWDNWIKGLLDAVDVFGEGNVTPGLVAGSEMCQPYGFKTVDEAIKSTSEGFEFLMSHGVNVRYNVWNISPLSALAGNQPPPLEYYVRLDRAWCETWAKYKLPPTGGFGPMGPGLATNSHASYNDMDPVLCTKARGLSDSPADTKPNGVVGGSAG